MKTLSKFVSMLFVLFSIILSNSTSVLAAEYDSEAVYDMNIGGTQNFVLEDSKGKEIYITILENSLQTRALENKSYSISLTAPLSWTAGYNVVIRNNLISSVNSPHYKCYTGKISSAALKKDSSKQATLRFTHTVLGISTRGGVRTNIADNKLKVSRL